MKENQVQEKFNEFKQWYQSKTIIGLVISSISGVVFALTQGQVDVQGATTELIAGAEEVAVGADQVISSVTFVIGQVVALWGRLTAKVGIKK
jgi:hypothetical protein